MVARKLVIALTLLAGLPAPLVAATPAAGTLDAPAAGQTTSISWSGGPYTGATADPSACTTLTCDSYTLTVNVPDTFYAANPDYAVKVGITWASSTNDFDLYVNDADGNTVCSSGQSNTTTGQASELADCGQLAAGTYTVQVVAFAVANSTYSGTASVGPEPVSPTGTARYKSGKFAFSTPQTLPGPADLAFSVQGIEPRVKADSLGNIYAAAIQGIPAGTDTWKSMDGGKTFTYLGQPDGAQAAAAVARGGGLGGGDEDLAIGTSGNVYVSSLWLGSATQSDSFNGGNTWVVNPVSTTEPIVDRQWIASYGNSVVYLTTKQLGAALNGTVSLFVAKSTDGGITFPQVTQVTTPLVGVQPGDQGNIEVDPNNGYVYTVFFDDSGKNLYIARSTNGGMNFDVKLVYANTVSMVNVFPSLAIDQAGNLYIVYSDSHAAYLTSSQDYGATWSTPVRVSNGSGTKSVIGPWVTAGAP
ncbi:MAG TPA: sialidase family protein, partial [Rhodanobacteraceae bacterium]